MTMQMKTFIWGHLTHLLSKSIFSQGTLDEFETMHTAQAFARFFGVIIHVWILQFFHLEHFRDEYNEDPVV